jgi:hypothetical protein
MSRELEELIERVESLERALKRLQERVEFIDARPWYLTWIPIPPPTPKYHPITYEDNTTWVLGQPFNTSWDGARGG